ncbi:hypothetical protein GA0070616_1071 [Micromonospora nigra]|uniref:Alpha amylase inhibitor n=1 Tax=Micromonospora nigra TaxID=145857 RepID=A0A1C6RHI4_9ACTN|nr:DUF6289 family protein [Micromonospora nigra]SCL16638.1 hypothetical protein GA0070616_1071 [Micromonospora nigra]
MIRRTLAAATVAAGIFALLPGAPAQARACMIDWQCTTYYYSDSSRTTIVGALYEDCDGYRANWGTRTAHVSFTEVPCR